MTLQSVLRYQRFQRSMAAAVSLLFVIACNGDGPTATVDNDAHNQSVTLSVGTRLDIILSACSPCAWESPPTVSGTAVSFLSAEYIPPFTPGGARQRFQFRAVEKGASRIEISRRDYDRTTLPSAFVLDVVVR